MADKLLVDLPMNSLIKSEQFGIFMKGDPGGQTMKHAFKLQKNKHPLWHLFVCANCGEEVRIGKPGMRRLMKGERIDLEDFLPPCRGVPGSLRGPGHWSGEVKQYSDCNLGEQK